MKTNPSYTQYRTTSTSLTNKKNKKSSWCAPLNHCFGRSPRVLFLSASWCFVSVLLLMTHRHTLTRKLGNLAPCSSKPRHTGRSNELPSDQLMFPYRRLTRVLLVLLKLHSPDIAGSAVNHDPSRIFALWYHNEGPLQQV